MASVDVRIARRVPGGDMSQHFGDHLVLALRAGHARAALVAREEFAIERQGHLQHACAHRFELTLGGFQHGCRIGARSQREAEFTLVEVGPQTPVIAVAQNQFLSEEILESTQRSQRRSRRAIEVGALIGGHRGANGLVQQRDIAFIFLRGHARPDRRRGGQIVACLVEEQGQLLEARDDVAHARRQGRVVQHEGGEQSIAHRFHVTGRVVQSALYILVIKQGQRDLILDDVVIRARFGRQAIALDTVLQALAKPLVILAMVVDASQAHIVELLIQILTLVPMQPRGGGRYRRKRERGVNEFFRELRKVVLRSAASGSDQGGHDDYQFRRTMAHVRSYNGISRVPDVVAAWDAPVSRPAACDS